MKDRLEQPQRYPEGELTLQFEPGRAQHQHALGTGPLPGRPQRARLADARLAAHHHQPSAKAGGAFGFTAEVADSDSPAETASGNLSLTVGVDSLVITTETVLPQAETGTPYSVKLTADGGIAPYIWALVSGSLPAGLKLRPNGTISGTPSAAAGSYGFSVQVSDSETSPVTTTQGFSLVIPPPITYVEPTQVSGNEGSTWEIPLTATGGTGSYTWSIVSGSLPAGLTFYPSGAITGTMDGLPGTYTLTFNITDSDNASGTGILTITILPVPQQLTITTTSLPDADAGPFYSTALSATGGSAPYKLVPHRRVAA